VRLGRPTDSPSNGSYAVGDYPNPEEVWPLMIDGALEQPAKEQGK